MNRVTEHCHSFQTQLAPHCVDVIGKLFERKHPC
jgi:hypothetical protein